MAGLGIDLGTANTVVWTPKRGAVYDEPSVLVLREAGRGRPRVAALGLDARALVGRAPQGYTAIRPLQDGVITDLATARVYLASVLRRMLPRRWQRARLRAVVGVPAGATTLERRALTEAAEEARLRRVSLVAEPIAGALGSGLDPMRRRMQMVVDVGGGTAEVTAFCYGGVVAHRSCRVAGDEMTLAVYRCLRDQHGLVVGELTAEDVKIRAARDEDPSLVVEGRDAASGRPRLLTVDVQEIGRAVEPVVDSIIQALASCLDDLPGQGIGDVLADGVLAFGGGALLLGFGQRLEKALGFPVRIAEEPLTCVARGAAECLSRPELLRVQPMA